MKSWIRCLIFFGFLAHLNLASPVQKRLFDISQQNNLIDIDVTSVSKTSNEENFLGSLFDFSEIKGLFNAFLQKSKSSSLCISCKVSVAFLQHYVNDKKASENDVGKIVYIFCSTLHIEKPSVCTGLVNLFKREVTQILGKVALDPDEFCGIVIGNGCGNPINPLHNWTIPLTPFPKPPVKPFHPPKSSAPILRVLQLSDTHLDPLYKAGSNADCGEPLCCREASGVPASPSDAAGFWGDYRNCDTPLQLLENLLNHISKTHKIDYVIWTGDIPPHDIWNNSRVEAVDLLHRVSKLLRLYLGNVPVFPVLGNHESSPVNSFPIPQIQGNDSINWLYEEVVKAWAPWLPSNILSTVKKGGYYSILIQPGFRIISLNMNYCNALNWWLLLNTTDPTGELEWLVYELQMAENKGEKVHIIGHIPPGEFDCLSVWSNNYNKIINRYESTVVAQFFGHTHKDEYEIFYDEKDNRASSIAYVGPSVTTYEYVNPGYRIYTVDGNYPKSSRAVLDHETYFMNLTEANIFGKPIWRHEYSAKKDFGMVSLTPADWHHLTSRFAEDDSLFQKFYRYHFKMSDYNVQPCDKMCKSVLLCRLRRSRSDHPLVC